MGNNIVPTAVRELKTADAEQVSMMTNDVLDLDRGLRDNNIELSLLNDALSNLGKTLDINKQMKQAVRGSMQKIITKL